MTRRVVSYTPSSESRLATYSSDAPAKRRHSIEEYVPPTKTHRPSDPDSIPLELMPTLRTLKGYGKRMNSLGALRVVWALDKVVEGIMPHINKYPELVDVVLGAKHTADNIRSEVTKSATGEQDDSDTEDDPT